MTNLTIVIMEMEITRGNGEIMIFFFFTMLDLVKLFSFSGSGFLHDIFFTRYTVTKFYNTFYS